MRDKFEATLLESGDLLKRSAARLAENMGRAVALITLIVSALVLFTDISFQSLELKSFTSTMTVMLLASYVMYFSMEDAGERLGEGSDEYKIAAEGLSALAERVGGDKISALRGFCKSYSEEELEYRRRNLLLAGGVGDDEYEAYKSGAVLDKRLMRAIRRAERLKAVPLTPNMLIAGEHSRSESEIKNPESRKLIGMILGLIPTTLSTALTVSVMFTAKENISVATVIDGLFKLSTLIVIGFKGYTAGYRYSRKTLVLWMKTKARLLDAFLLSEGAKK